MLGRGVAGVTRYPVRLLRSLPRAIPNVDETPFGVLPGAGTIGGITRTILRRSQRPPKLDINAPKTRFNGRITPHRRFPFCPPSAYEGKAGKKHHGAQAKNVRGPSRSRPVCPRVVGRSDLPAQPHV